MSGALTRESTYIRSISRTLWMMRDVSLNSPRTIVDIVADIAAKKPGNIALLCGDHIHTYKMLEEGANRYANWAASLGIRRGEAIVLLMENRPEYLMAWLGLLQLGAIVALI